MQIIYAYFLESVFIGYALVFHSHLVCCVGVVWLTWASFAQQDRDTWPHRWPTDRLWSQGRLCSWASFPRRQQSQHIYNKEWMRYQPKTQRRKRRLPDHDSCQDTLVRSQSFKDKEIPHTETKISTHCTVMRWQQSNTHQSFWQSIKCVCVELIKMWACIYERKFPVYKTLLSGTEL